MENNSFNCSIKVKTGADEALRKISKVADWWGITFSGKAEKQGDTFVVKMGGDSFFNFTVEELIPGKRLVWHITDCNMPWYSDKKEWANTSLVFDLNEKNGETTVNFTHEGLTPDVECYYDCQIGWSHWIKTSLTSYLETGKGDFDKKNYHVAITVQATPGEALKKISQVNKWWAKNVKGSSESLNDKFTVDFGETFVDFEITELVPGKKVVWKVTDCNLHWIKTKKEWKGTQVVFEITPIDNSTSRIDFTHAGLLPALECYADCEAGWNEHVKDSLVKYINAGKGMPM